MSAVFPRILSFLRLANQPYSPGSNGLPQADGPYPLHCTAATRTIRLSQNKVLRRTIRTHHRQ